MDAKTELLAALGEMISDAEALRQIQVLLGQYSIIRDIESKHCNLKKRIEHFITAKRIDGLSKKTLAEYNCKLGMFSSRIQKHVTKISADDVREYLEYLTKERHLKESSVQTHICTLRSFFAWLDTEDIIKKNPMRKIKSSKIDRKNTRKPLTSEELEQLRNACRTYKEKAIVEFLVSSGCRLSEAVGIELSQVNWQERSVIVHGKGGKDRIVYFSVRAKLMLEEYIKQRRGGTSLFSGKGKPYIPLQSRAIQNILQNIGKRVESNRRIHPHLMRHTFATNALNGGMDITVIQKLLGHSDPKTTLIYAELSPRTVQFEYEKVVA